MKYPDDKRAKCRFPTMVKTVLTNVATNFLARRKFGRSKQESNSDDVEWLTLIDHAEANFSRRAVAYYVGLGAETRAFSFAEREQLAARYGRELGEPRLLISEIAQGGSEERFYEGVRAWFERECIPFNVRRGVSDALNGALLARAKARADRELDDYERKNVR